MSPAASRVVDRCPTALAAGADAVVGALVLSARGVPAQPAVRAAARTRVTAGHRLAPTGSPPCMRLVDPAYCRDQPSTVPSPSAMTRNLHLCGTLLTLSCSGSSLERSLQHLMVSCGIDPSGLSLG
jgi:hypothetical protein